MQLNLMLPGSETYQCKIHFMMEGYTIIRKHFCIAHYTEKVSVHYYRCTIIGTTKLGKICKTNNINI